MTPFLLLAALFLPASTALPLEQKGDTQDNLLADASCDFVAAAVGQNIDRTEPVSDVILKTRIFGTGRTVGKVDVQLVPSAEVAVIDLLTSGTTYTETVGVKGPVRLYSDSTIPFQIKQRVYLSPEGVRSDAACARAENHSTLTGLETDLCLLDPLVRKMACKKYRKNKEEGEEIASRHAEERLTSSSQTESAPLLQDAERAIKDSLGQLRESGLEFTSLRFNSSTDAVLVRGRVAADAKITVPPPPLPKAYLGLRVHEAAVNRWADANLAGKTYTGEELEKKAKKLGPGTTPKQSEDQEYSITFTKTQPLEVTFADKGLQAILHLAEFTSGDNEYSGMELTVKYRFAPAGDKIKAVRVGPIEAFPPGFKKGQKLSARQQAMRSVLQKRFAKVFKEEILLTDIELPTSLEKAGPLVATAAAGDNGWFLMTWRKRNTK